jgi:hypothetical protein
MLWVLATCAAADVATRIYSYRLLQLSSVSIDRRKNRPRIFLPYDENISEPERFLSYDP